MRHALTAALTVAALTACAPGTDTTSSDLPACADVWRDGNQLPTEYDGCTTDDTTVPAVWVDCAAGGRYTSYDDEFYAREGGEVYGTAGDVARLYRRCAK